MSDYTIRNWTKLTTVCESHSYLWSAAIVSQGPNYDAPWFTPALRQTSRVLGLYRLIGDAAFDAEEHYRLAKELGIALTVIALNPRGGRQPPEGSYRRRMADRFPWQLYRHRWHVESSFSQDKRVLGSSLRSRSDEARERECYLRVLTHNLMLITWLYLVFNRAHRTLNMLC